MAGKPTHLKNRNPASQLNPSRRRGLPPRDLPLWRRAAGGKTGGGETMQEETGEANGWTAEQLHGWTAERLEGGAVGGRSGWRAERLDGGASGGKATMP